MTYLNALIMCPLEETGFAFSRYAVKLSSRQRTSGWVEPAGNEGLRGEFGVVWEAVATMPHIGQPALGAKEAISLCVWRSGDGRWSLSLSLRLSASTYEDSCGQAQSS